MVHYVSKVPLKHIRVCSSPEIAAAPKCRVALYWEEQMEASFKEITKILALLPVLVFYDAKKESPLQVDASSTGLGAALIQEG